MYNLTIHFGPNAVAWSFLFKTKDKADACFKLAADVALNGGVAAITDDYGQVSLIRDVWGMLLEDTEQGTEARILRGLDHARGQARATKRAMTDPELLQAQREQRGGPSVITPFTNGGFRPQ